jgi:hypothetical protein
MRSFDDFDSLARHRVSVAGDDDARERARPIVLDGFCHCRRRFAGADDDGATFWRFGQMPWQAARGLRGQNRGIEHRAQQVARIGHQGIAYCAASRWPISKLASFSSERTSAE